MQHHLTCTSGLSAKRESRLEAKKKGRVASIAPIDEEQLFYLETRGISRQSAENLLVAAFLEDVLGRVPLKPLAKHLAKVIEEKVRG